MNHQAVQHLRKASEHLSSLAVLLEGPAGAPAGNGAHSKPIDNPVFLYAGRINDGVPDIAEDPFGQHSSGFCRVVEDYVHSRGFLVYVKVLLGTDAGDAAKILRDVAGRIEANPAWLSPDAAEEQAAAGWSF